jgi:hypothetical protein
LHCNFFALPRFNASEGAILRPLKETLVEKEAKEDDGGNTVVAAPAKKLGVGTRASVAGAVKSEESGSTSGSLRDQVEASFSLSKDLAGPDFFLLDLAEKLENSVEQQGEGLGSRALVELRDRLAEKALNSRWPNSKDEASVGKETLAEEGATSEAEAPFAEVKVTEEVEAGPTVAEEDQIAQEKFELPLVESEPIVEAHGLESEASIIAEKSLPTEEAIQVQQPGAPMVEEKETELH